MIGERVRDIQFLPRLRKRYHEIDTFVITETNVYSIHMGGYRRCTGFSYRRSPEDGLPSELIGRRIAGLRCDGESIILELEGNVFIYRSFSIDTRTQDSIIELTIHRGEDVTEELLAFYRTLSEAGESESIDLVTGQRSPPASVPPPRVETPRPSPPSDPK